MSARARSQDKAVAWAKGSQVRRQLPYSARRHPQQPPPCVQLVVQCLRVQVVTCSGCPFLDAHQKRETVLDLEQADFSAAHLREVLQQRHDLLLEDEVILVALGPGTALSAQLDLALDDRVRVSSGSPSRTGMLVMRPKLMSCISSMSRRFGGVRCALLTCATASLLVRKFWHARWPTLC